MRLNKHYLSAEESRVVDTKKVDIGFLVKRLNTIVIVYATEGTVISPAEM